MRTKLLRLLLSVGIVLAGFGVIVGACLLKIFGVPVILVLVFGLVVSIPVAMVYDALEFDFISRRNRRD